MLDFKIRQGLSTVLFSEPGVINKNLIIEEGCWYLCTDTAELFLGVYINDELSLKKINEETQLEVNVPTKLSELLNDCGYLTEIPANYVVKDDIRGFALKTDLEGLATESYVDTKVASIKIPEVPSKVSDLANDLGYITAIPDSYATKEYVDSEIAKAELAGQDVDLSAYYTKTETDTAISSAISNKADRSELFNKDYNELINKPNIPSIEGLATEKFVNESIAKINTPDVSEFITMSDVEAKGYLTEIPSNYVTSEDISDFAKKSEIPTDYVTATKLEEEISKIEHPTVDLNNYVTKDEIKGFVSEIPAEYITESELDAKGFLTQHQDLSHLATKEELPDTSKFITSIPSEYITESELASKGYLTEHQSLAGYATQTYVDEAIADIDIPEIDTSEFVTTEVFENSLINKANKIPFNADKFVTISVGNFSIGDSVKGLSIAEILAKLLGLSDNNDNPGPDVPDVPDTPDEPKGIIETIKANNIPMYAINADGNLAEVPYNYLGVLTEAEGALAPTTTGFYQIQKENGDIESGYQEIQTNHSEVLYIIALPKDIDFNTMVDVKVWDNLKGNWTDTSLNMTSDPDEIAELFNDNGEVDISHIDTDVYTVWVQDDVPTGSKLRFVINE